jgi:hypothetical protein
MDRNRQIQFSMEYLTMNIQKKDDDSFKQRKKMSSLLIVIVTINYTRHKNSKKLIVSA